MADGFTYGDRNSWDFDMHVEKLPAIGGAKRRVTKLTVPGRSGDLHMDEGVYDSYIQPYECYFHGRENTPEQAHAIQQWLLGDGGYRRLVDVYDPKHYRMAFFTGPLNVENILNKYGRCVVNFEVDPRAYLCSGENPIAFTASGPLTNLTGYPAQPLIRVTVSGAGTLYVGGASVEILTAPESGELWLDCEEMNAWDDSGSRNNCVSCVDFPVLEPGENEIYWDGGITSVEIIPRWWVL